MSLLDWVVLGSFLIFVVGYGTWKTRGSKDVKSYLLASQSAPWHTVAISIMATQASAVTFLSTPGQAYTDGMRFLQLYLGLPIAVVIISITAIPVYHRLGVYTAYEYLETRFDLKNRALGSLLFLIQRGFAAGFSIFAPALVLSVLLNWSLTITVLVIGTLVTTYTVVGGTNAVNKTHAHQMTIVMLGMITAFVVILFKLPPDVSIKDAAYVAGKMGKLNTIDFSFDLNNRYNFWSGIIGGTFLMLSYFGTDQSQVQRYLAGRSVSQSRLGLLLNGIIKVPMQFFILLTGALVFVFYQFVTPPMFFNSVETAKVKNSYYAAQYESLEKEYDDITAKKQADIREMLQAIAAKDDERTSNLAEAINSKQREAIQVRNQAVEIIEATSSSADPNDSNYIFLHFVIKFLPAGIIGLILAAIISASMASCSAELNALASTSLVDIYRRLIKKDAPDRHYLLFSKVATIFWGLYAIAFAEFANRLGSLIEAVNILGSLFYGTILGIFLVAFYLKRVNGTATFYSAIVAEATVIYCYFFTELPFLWFNVVGCLVVVGLAVLISALGDKGEASSL